MMIIFSRFFWGFVLVVIGVLAVLQNFFGISIDFWGILWPILLIFIGLNVLLKPYRHYSLKTEKEIIFDEGEIKANEEEKEYNTIFGKGEFDFRNIELKDKTLKFKANAIFSDGDKDKKNNTG